MMAEIMEIAARKIPGSSIESLTPWEEKEITNIKLQFPNIPQDYFDFLEIIGWGEIGYGRYMIYGELLNPSDVYLGEDENFKDVVLFGDDFSGYCAGFKKSDGTVVEIEPTNMSLIEYDRNFLNFIEKKI